MSVKSQTTSPLQHSTGWDAPFCLDMFLFLLLYGLFQGNKHLSLFTYALWHIHKTLKYPKDILGGLVKLHKWKGRFWKRREDFLYSQLWICWPVSPDDMWWYWLQTYTAMMHFLLIAAILAKKNSSHRYLFHIITFKNLTFLTIFD